MWLALHLQVHGGEAELVPFLSGQLLLLQAAAHTETAAHCGHLAVELLPCDFMVKAQPTEFNLHTGQSRREQADEKEREKKKNYDIQEPWMSHSCENVPSSFTKRLNLALVWK